MKTFVATIEKALDGGIAVYCEDIKGVYGFGETETEAIEMFESIVPEQAEFFKSRTGKYPDWYSEEIKFEYLYNLSGFFEAFPFINVSQFAKAVGINQSLMRKYKSGAACASAKQKAAIQKSYDKLVSRMSDVRF